MKKVKVGEEQAGQRLDVSAVHYMPELSRAFVQKLCDTGKIQINDKPSKAGYKVREGDKLTIDYDV
jgi:23S rRNA pseudouridine1911/1915/1917 synthase